MKRIYVPVLIVLAAAPPAAALDRAQIQALVRIAERASGITARSQVRVVAEPPARFAQRRTRLLDRAYPRAAQAHDETVYHALGIAPAGPGELRKTLLALERRRAVYDVRAQTAYVRAGPSERSDALPVIVNALQDQRYDLRRVAALPGGSDAARAAAALVEGHAALVTKLVPARRSASHGSPRLERFLRLQRGFADSVGLRFASDLRNLGGNRAVLAALARLPSTTEQVFHLDKYLQRERATPILLPVEAAGMTLAGTSTFGELDVRALLAVFAVPRLDHVGSGWAGGRTAVYRGEGGAVVVAIDWDTELDAREWAEAVTVYVNEAFDAATPGLPAPVSCGAEVCWQVGGRTVAFQRDRRRTSLVVGAELEPAAALARAAIGLV
jgi:hypothetical protein